MTSSLIAGFNTYGFKEAGEFPELSRIAADDLPGHEFWLAGEIVRQMEPKEQRRLEAQKVTMRANPQRLLEELAGHWQEEKS